MIPRQWRLTVDVQNDAMLYARVKADDQLLMPLARFGTPDEVLGYFAAALVDFRRGDTLSTIVTTERLEPMICLLSSRDGVLSWLGPRLVEVWHTVKVAYLSAAAQAE